ncbi:unnamed protein product [Cuscuta epithymum]|uniref:RNase H type-1 domain-containing protein n=1 Tax=Cuscuta epithymum TaxID=186058 RepID=A0AAV0CHP3_9ASTE|nr:unnamed protein product [Cuscuta epithymum]
MNVFLFPKDMCVELERIMNGFWWTGSSGKGIRWKDWNNLSTPKKGGGLGFKRLREFNLAMLGKQSWRIFTKPHCLVAKVLKARDRELILGIPVSQRHVPDKLVWRWEENGNYSVKSSYKFLMQSSGNVSSYGWTRMWNLPIPPKVKFFFWQACIGCLPTADTLMTKRQVWGLMNWSFQLDASISFEMWVERLMNNHNEERCSKFIMLIWGLWNARNTILWQQVYTPPQSIVAGALTFLEGWQQAQGTNRKSQNQLQTTVRWVKPDEGRVKINTDAAVKTGSGSMGLEWIARSSEGEFIVGGAINRTGVFLPREAEALAVREALSWLKEAGWDHIDLETDSLQLIKSIQSGEDESSFGVIVGDIRELSTSFNDITFAHVRRSANRAAHDMAKAADSMSGCHIWFSFHPDCISASLNHDYINTS